MTATDFDEVPVNDLGQVRLPHAWTQDEYEVWRCTFCAQPVTCFDLDYRPEECPRCGCDVRFEERVKP